MPEKVKPAPAPSWLKSVEAIAAAMGLRLYAQRPKKIAQLAAVRALTAAPGFPAKVKGYWPRAEVVEFIAARVEVCKKGREFKVVAAPRAKPETGNRKPEKSGFKSQVSALPLVDSTAQREAVGGKPETGNLKPENGELPPAKHPAGEDDLFFSESAEAKMNRRLDLLEDKYFFPEKYPESKIAKFEIDELKRERPWLWSKGGADGGAEAVSENISGGVRGVANHIRNNFPGVICDHMSISRWLRGEYLPPGCKENFPPADEGNRYKAALVKVWVEKYLVKPLHGQNLPVTVADPRSRQEAADAAISELKLQQMQRATSEKHMETATVLGFVGGFAHWVGLAQDKLIEDRGGVRKLVAEEVAFLNLTPEQLVALDTKLSARLAAANGAMKTATAHRVAELVDDLVEKRKAEIQEAQAT